MCSNINISVIIVFLQRPISYYDTYDIAGDYIVICS